MNAHGDFERMRRIANEYAKDRDGWREASERMENERDAARREAEGLRAMIAPGQCDPRTDYATIAEILHRQAAAQEASALEAADLRARVEALESGLRAYLECPDSHYAHHDPMGTAGRNCPACIARGDANDSARALLAPPAGDNENNGDSK